MTAIHYHGRPHTHRLSVLSTITNTINNNRYSGYTRLRGVLTAIFCL